MKYIGKKIISDELQIDKRNSHKEAWKNPGWNPCLPDKTLVGRYYHPSHEATRREWGKNDYLQGSFLHLEKIAVIHCVNTLVVKHYRFFFNNHTSLQVKDVG